MKLCRYDDDRLGVVRGNLVHDVTLAQTEIRNSLPYAMKVDAVVAACRNGASGSNAWPTKRPASPVPRSNRWRPWRVRPSSPARRPITRRTSRK